MTGLALYSIQALPSQAIYATPEPRESKLTALPFQVAAIIPVMPPPRYSQSVGHLKHQSDMNGNRDVRVVKFAHGIGNCCAIVQADGCDQSYLLI